MLEKQCIDFESEFFFLSQFLYTFSFAFIAKYKVMLQNHKQQKQQSKEWCLTMLIEWSVTEFQ